MKILRVLRRRKIRLSFILILLFIFIVNTYAWFSYRKDVESGSFILNVTPWEIDFTFEGEEVKEEYTYVVEEFYPGIDPIVKTINIHNLEETDGDIKVRIKQIFLYGQEIKIIENELHEQVPETVGEETVTEDGYKTANAFGNGSATIFDEENTNYDFSLSYPTPFSIYYLCEKDHIKGAEENQTGEAWVTLNFEWFNDENNNVEDTKLGTMAYDFKETNPDEPAIRIVVEVTVSKTPGQD